MSHRKRLLLVLGIAVAAGLAGFAGWRFWPDEPGVTPENWSRVHRGMTESQLVSRLGEPTTREEFEDATSLRWRAPPFFARVLCDERGEAETGSLRMLENVEFVSPLPDAPETLVMRLRRRFGL